MLSELGHAALRELCLRDGPYVLIESPYGRLPAQFTDAVIDLQLHGFRPVLAHPERCGGFLEDRSPLVEMTAHGVGTSVTAGSMAGQFGGRVRDLTAWLFMEGLVTNVASDAHDVYKRPPGLTRGFEELDGLLPGLAEQASWYTRDAPAAMLAGADLPDRPEPPRRRRAVTRLLRSRR